MGEGRFRSGEKTKEKYPRWKGIGTLHVRSTLFLERNKKFSEKVAKYSWRCLTDFPGAVIHPLSSLYPPLFLYSSQCLFVQVVQRFKYKRNYDRTRDGNVINER